MKSETKIRAKVVKVRRQGGSYVITIPKDWVESLGLEPGDEVAFVYDKIAKIIVIDERL